MARQENETWKSLTGMCAAICNGADYTHKIIENTLQHHDCVNSLIPATPYYLRERAEIIGNTLLHITLKQRKHAYFEFLINQGADFTLKNTKGETVLHQAFLKSENQSKECDKLWGKIIHSYIHSVLNAHVELRKSSNPSNNNGLTHFHIACMVNHVKAVEFFFKNGVSVRQTVNFESPSLPGYSPLHFAARYCAYETVQFLLEHGADANLKDAKGLTPLHLLLERNVEIADWLNTGRQTHLMAFEKEAAINEAMIGLLLEHLCNGAMPHILDDKGFGLLHVACTLRNDSMAEKLVRLGHNLELAVANDSPLFPGYRPLHFAAHFNIETVKLLVRSGANVTSTDATGVRPFDICLHRLDIVRGLNVLVDSQPAWRDVTFSDGKTSLLNFAQAMHQQQSLQDFLRGIDVNMRLPPDSALWPGFTPLHFLVMFVVNSNGAWDLYESSDMAEDVSWYNLRMIEAIECCLKLGADVTAQDCQGYSPLHLAFRLQKTYLVTVLLRSHSNNFNPVDKNGLSHFHIACVANNENYVIRMLKGRLVDINKPVPFGFRLCKDKKRFFFARGSTPLHIAVITKNVELAGILLRHGASNLCKDDDGLLPLHRLFGLSRTDDLHLANMLISSYNFSFMKDLIYAVATCGLTYLHVVSYWDKNVAVEELLDLGVDIDAVIAYEGSDISDCGRTRCRSIQSDRPIDSLGFLDRYAGYTPLRLAIEAKNHSVTRVLVRRGADILAKHNDGMTPLYNILNSKYSSVEMMNLFVEAVQLNAALENRILADSGLTLLHLACSISDLDLIKHLCSQGLDVNARAHVDSPIWPGCTPLHVLMIKSSDDPVIETIVEVINLLLNCGADVTLTNADQKTPLHEDFERFFVLGPRYASLLLNAQRDFSINPVSIKGISHFHIACMCKEVAIVQEFLKYGADVNLPISYFCELYGGLTPLHLASVRHLRDVYYFLGKRRITNHAIEYIFQMQENSLYLASDEHYKNTVDSLLQHGANPHTTDRFGNTSLHVAAMARSPLLGVLQSLVSAGAVLNCENFLGETPLEILLQLNNVTSKFVEFFLGHGNNINIYNPADGEGFIPRVLQLCRNRERNKNALCEALSNLPDINYFDEEGRSLIQNIVSHKSNFFDVSDYIKFIEVFEKLGHGIDHRDKKGQTALHLAIEFQNLNAVLGLFACGADINVLDRNDKAMLVLNDEFVSIPGRMENSTLLKNFAAQIYKLNLCELYVNSTNQELDIRIRQELTFDFTEVEKMCADEVNLLKSMIIEPYPLSLYNFLSDTGVVAAYPMLSQIQRRAINDFFRNNNSSLRQNFLQLSGLMQMQLKKAIARVALLESAKDALSIVMRNYFPDLCSELILRFVTNKDLKNLMTSVEI